MTSLRPLMVALILPTFGLAACAPEAEEDVTYEVGVEDVGGGELQVADPQPGEVQVNLPETPMRNVPAEEAAPASEATEASEDAEVSE